MRFFDKKKVLVTGGAGFIGSHTVEELLRRAPKARVTVVDDLSHGKRENLNKVLKDISIIKADLRTQAGVRKACRGQEVVLHLAAKVAGVGYNSTHQAEMFSENMKLSMAMMEGARAAGVRRLLVVSSACVYAGGAPVPTAEEQGFVGKPEAANEGYGFAKRMAEFLGQMYAREHGLEVAIARPYNAYGPRDRYGKSDSHVIAALIWRALRGENPMLVWGDGKPTRSFCYVEDLARGLLDCAEKYAVADPVNIGTDEEVSIGELARMVLELAGSKAKLTFDPSKPAGQKRRACDTTKAFQKIDYRAQVPLKEGLRRSIDWCREHYFK